MKAFISFFIFLLFVITNFCFAQTNIPQGDVSGIWTIENSPYLIYGDLEIPNDSTLTIEPGVTIEFQGHYKLNVEGRLLAVGTESDTIVFTINDTTGFSNIDIPDGGWHGITFNPSAGNDSSMIIYCKLQYGKAVGPNWQDNEGGAIRVYNFSKLIISNCLIDKNIAHGGDYSGGGAVLIAQFSNIIILDCIISNNSSLNGGGIMIPGYATPSIINCTITNNHADDSGGGINCRDIGNPLIKNVVLNGNTATYEIVSAFPEITPTFPCIVLNPIVQNTRKLGVDQRSNRSLVCSIDLDFYAKTRDNKSAIDIARGYIQKILENNWITESLTVAGEAGQQQDIQSVE